MGPLNCSVWYIGIFIFSFYFFFSFLCFVLEKFIFLLCCVVLLAGRRMGHVIRSRRNVWGIFNRKEYICFHSNVSKIFIEWLIDSHKYGYSRGSYFGTNDELAYYHTSVHVTILFDLDTFWLRFIAGKYLLNLSKVTALLFRYIVFCMLNSKKIFNLKINRNANTHKLW